MVLSLAVATWLVGLAVAGFFLICLLMILTVLIQRPQGGGLSGAFGSGAGSGQTAFGAKTGDALTVFTIVVFVVYILSAVGLNILVQPVSPLDVPEVTSTEPTPIGGQPAPEGTATPGGAVPDPSPEAVPTVPEPQPSLPPQLVPVVPMPEPTPEPAPQEPGTPDDPPGI